VARKDDIIVLSNGEKVMPAVTEGIMRTHPLVADALLFGRGQEQVGLLIELKQPTPEGDVGAHPSIIDAIWYAMYTQQWSTPQLTNYLGRLCKKPTRRLLTSRAFSRR
jgi:long-subunit acyl-CoA synthetase (AMP-forming)